MKIIQIILGAALGSLIANLLREKVEHKNTLSRKQLIENSANLRERMERMRDERNKALNQLAMSKIPSTADRQRGL